MALDLYFVAAYKVIENKRRLDSYLALNVTSVNNDRQSTTSALVSGENVEPTMSSAETSSLARLVGLPLGPVLAATVFMLLPDSYADIDGITVLGQPGRATAAVAIWMACWWLTEAIPLAATALLPLALLPLLQAVPIKAAAAPYGHYLIFLFLGGFILSLAMQRWGLHRRIALSTLAVFGTQPTRLVGGFMLTTAGLSMWVSNTATCLMMLPIAVSVIEMLERDRPMGAPGNDQLAVCLLLAIAYSASIGGIGTLIGTPPNLFLASFLRDSLGIDVGFAQWLRVGLPVVVIFLPLTWWMLTRWLYPITGFDGAELDINELRAHQGPMNTGERITLVIFLTAVAAWIFRPLLNEFRFAGVSPLAGLTDTGIAVCAALLLFVTPVDLKKRIFAMDWAHASRLPWGILILFGGGLSLADAIENTGVGDYIGHQVGHLQGVHPLLIALAVATLVIFLTELTSNLATTATLVPILAAIAPPLGIDPMLLVVTATIAASCAFMMPVATPPNAIVFGSGRITIPQMYKAGLPLNFVGIALVTAVAYWVAVPVFVISLR